MVEFRVPLALNPNRLDFGWLPGSRRQGWEYIDHVSALANMNSYLLILSFTLIARHPSP